MPTVPAPFRCLRCGACCRWEGYVRLTHAEVDAAAAFLGLPARDFVERYTTLTDDRRGLTLVEREDGACIMLSEDNRCLLQPVKPAQCRGFPLEWSFPGHERLCPGVETRASHRQGDGEATDATGPCVR